MINTKYVIITPARNEEKLIRYTLESVCSQTIKPSQWIIVDDGSQDNTVTIVEEYAEKYKWIMIVHTDTFEEKRAGGSKVVRAFNRGYSILTNEDYDFIVKLDADLTLPQDYFENVAKCFKENEHIGLCGGYCINPEESNLKKEKSAEFHVRGAFKAYRKKCFQEIGGLKPVWLWDGLDQMMAMQKGWEIKVLPLAVIHHRETTNEYNRIKHSFRHGKEYYKMGHGLFLGILKSIFLLPNKPLGIGGITFFTGFFLSALKREEKIVEKDLEKYIRKFQYTRFKRLLNKSFISSRSDN